MGEQKRISGAEVVRAYRKTGLRPRQRATVDGPKCGCPIAALYVAQGGTLSSDKATNWAVDRYGCAYTTGFINGVDGFRNETTRLGREAYRDGRAAWAAVVEAGLVG